MSWWKKTKICFPGENFKFNLSLSSNLLPNICNMNHLFVCPNLFFSPNTFSGGHINPAVTLAMVVAGRLEACKLPLYWAGQTLGAFLASALCFGVYNGEFFSHDFRTFT